MRMARSRISDEYWFDVFSFIAPFSQRLEPPRKPGRFSHIVDSLGMVGILMAPGALHFQIEKEALHHRVVPAVTLATHAALKAVANQ